MINFCSAMMDFTRSPMEITPRTSPASITGKWRIRYFGHQGHTLFDILLRLRMATRVVMISWTAVVLEERP